MAEKRYVEVNNLEVGNYVTIWDVDGEYGRQTVMAVDDLAFQILSEDAMSGGSWDWTAEPMGKDGDGDG